MKKMVIIAVMGLMSVFNVNAQDYQTALGVRGGIISGISLKHFTTSTTALEGVIGTHYRGLLLAGMFQKHTPAFDVLGLKWYYGGGAHLGFYNRRYSPWYRDDEVGAFTTLGIIGVVGLEYKIDEIPIVVGVDVSPVLHVIGRTGLWWDSGVTLRYTFN